MEEIIFFILKTFSVLVIMSIIIIIASITINNDYHEYDFSIDNVKTFLIHNFMNSLFITGIYLWFTN